MTPEAGKSAMRCDEMQEHFVELLYQEQGTPTASPEVQEHVRSCAACRTELAELKGLQTTLTVWQDEPPLRPVTLPRNRAGAGRVRLPLWSVFRYAAIAVLVTLAFLGLSNAQIQWDRNGFSFRTSLRAQQATSPSNYYTKEEVKAIILRAQDANVQVSYQMIQDLLRTIDQERAGDFQMLTLQLKQSRNKN
jgi:predicted anti-sigma-YlaC factor YlaD